MARWPYNTAGWRRTRAAVLEAAGWTCCECGEPGFEVHHKVPIRAGGAVWDPANLEVRCRSCHSIEHAGGRPEWGPGVG